MAVLEVSEGQFFEIIDASGCIVVFFFSSTVSELDLSWGV
jgi:hypothetical protein